MNIIKYSFYSYSDINPSPEIRVMKCFHKNFSTSKENIGLLLISNQQLKIGNKIFHSQVCECDISTLSIKDQEHIQMLNSLKDNKSKDS